MPPPSPLYISAAVLTSTLFLGFTVLWQEARLQTGVLLSFLFYFFVYTLMVLFPTLCQPTDPHVFSRPSSQAYPAQWRDYVVSSINAVLQLVGGVCCLLEWQDFQPVGDGWVGVGTPTLEDKPFTSVQYAGCLLIGYLTWDLGWIIWHYEKTPDVAMVLHHVLFLLVAHYNAKGWYFSKCYAWMAFAEMSTVFLNNRWCLLTLGRKDDPVTFCNSLCFAGSFLLFRIVLATWGLYDVWMNVEHWRSGGQGVHCIVVGLHLVYAMNLVWAKKVVANVQKAMRKTEGTGEKKD